VIETEPDEAEEESNVDHGADTHVTSEVDEEEEAKDHAKREGNAADKDSIDTDTEESLDNITNKLEEAVDVLTGDGDVLVSKLAGSVLTLEELDDTKAVDGDTGKESKEGNPAEETKDGELVGEEDDEENVDNAEDKKRGHQVVPHEDLLSLAEELALLEGLGDHVAGALTTASRGGSLGSLSRGFLLGSFLNGCRLFCGCGFLNLFFFRHL